MKKSVEKVDVKKTKSPNLSFGDFASFLRQLFSTLFFNYSIIMDSTAGFENVPLRTVATTSRYVDSESGQEYPEILNNSKEEKIRRRKFEKYVKIILGIMFVLILVFGVFAILSFFSSNSTEEIEKQIDDLFQKVNHNFFVKLHFIQF